MSNRKRTAIYLVVIGFATALAVAISFAIGQGGSQILGIPVTVWCAVLAFSINWGAFIPANIAQTERFYDLTGSLTYLSVIGFAVYTNPNLDLRGILVALAVVLWATRLGTFLFSRIIRDGRDDRFDEVKPVPIRFFMAWTLQALWVVLTAACALTVITSSSTMPLDVFAYLGFFIWIVGFCIEIIADQQKSAFKADESNQGKFIQSGLWSRSRHPNYFGEIMLWVGLAIVALPVLVGMNWFALISPVFVYFLIVKITGINKLEIKAEKKWGGLDSYKLYKKNTPILLLKPMK